MAATNRHFRPELPESAEAFARQVLANLYHTRGQAVQTASEVDLVTALAVTVRDYLVERFRRTADAYFKANPKFVYYLSAEYLLGRQLPMNLLATGTEAIARQACERQGLRLDDLIALDPEPGLGNGGLGRLAACFLDSMATLGIPGVGYGIRYEFGIFRQSLEDGWQREHPDDWLRYGNPWEYPHPDDMVEVGFYGRTEHRWTPDRQLQVRWVPGRKVLGEPCHMLVPGFETPHVNLIRLWRARASREFDLECFDVGDYTRAVEDKVGSENISKVLYPNDTTDQGRELRLKQQYFFVACSLKDILRRFRLRNQDWDELPEKAVIQLNDTHPVVAIPELMRILVDEEGLPWERAWDITTRTFAYTCHTLLPEALERWPVPLFQRLLPRHLEIVYEVNRRFLDQVRARHPDDAARVVRMSLIEEGEERRIRMAHLATVGSFAVNGVARLQSRLLAERTLPDFAAFWPERFTNVTNGVTPRRFVRLANPRLSELITSRIGDSWVRDLDQLARLEPFAHEEGFRREWRAVKRENKEELAEIARALVGTEVDPGSLFDVMVKRLHEYKRQLLKALHIIALYRQLKSDPGLDLVPRTFVFGAKAAPGYRMAKLIIKLVNAVGERVNDDPDVNGRLRVVFLPNFNVTLAERVYPAADLSEQISMAGKEASGTGNMKFALNGALTIGTLDGANVEIRERVGQDNFFLFGLTAEEAFSARDRGYDPGRVAEADPELQGVLNLIADGHFSDGDRDLFRPLLHSLLGRDEYLLLADFRSYLDAQDRVDEVYRDPERWTRMSILNAARCGYFSSDRAVDEYCRRIWKVEPVAVPEPTTTPEDPSAGGAG